jgi:hypothetical protein
MAESAAYNGSDATTDDRLWRSGFNGIQSRNSYFAP